MLIFLQHLREFGLVYQRKVCLLQSTTVFLKLLKYVFHFTHLWYFQRKAGRFYPTRLAMNIACTKSTAPTAVAAAPTAQAGYIVVETNYRVYAYTDSNLQVALLGLFTELLYR